MPKKILITGGYGLIGNVVYGTLNERPDIYDVYVLARRRQRSDRLPVDQLCPIPDHRLHLADLSDFASVQRAVEGMDTVVHMAADAREFTGWDSVHSSNVIGTYHVFEACRLAGVERIVFASTLQVSYGYRTEEPYRLIYQERYADLPAEIPVVGRESSTRPLNLYAASKVWGEALAHVYAHTYGMSCICLRIGWVLAEDRPPEPEARYEWCSQRDIAQLVERCINAPRDVRFDIFFGISNNQYRWVDIDHARRVVGYEPQDWSEDHL